MPLRDIGRFPDRLNSHRGLEFRLSAGMDFRDEFHGAKEEVFIMTTGRYESSDSSNVGTAITFLLIGLGAGTLLGMLLAPKTGKQLRRDLRRGYEDARENLGDWAEDAKERAREVGDRVRDAASRGAEFAEEMRSKVEPLRKAINRS
jgi:gas vesicle protein